MRRNWLWLLALLAACDRAPPRAERPPARPSAAQPSSAKADEIRTARAAIQSARERKLVVPKRFRELSCDDALSGANRELSLRVVDARYDTRHVLPLRITRHLSEPDLNQLDAVLAGIERSEELDHALRTASALSTERFLAAYHVVHYASPKWLVRVGHAKPSWDAGRLDAWFVVHDARSGEPLCATRLSVVGAAQGAPRTVRLRSETRERLQDALGERMRAATPRALARIAASLTLPSAT